MIRHTGNRVHIGPNTHNSLSTSVTSAYCSDQALCPPVFTVATLCAHVMQVNTRLHLLHFPFDAWRARFAMFNAECARVTRHTDLYRLVAGGTFDYV
jgi:hypothetical protein